MTSMTCVPLVLAFACALHAPLAAEEAAKPSPTTTPPPAAIATAASVLAPQIAAAAGADAWSKMSRLRFSWRHLPSDTARTYDWRMRSGVDGGEVTITMPGSPDVTLPAKWQAPATGADPAQVKAHQGFINDSYWLLFSLHVGWDQPTCSDLGEVDVPQLPDLGKRPAVSVTYPNAGGYTPGDSYVLYLGTDHLPVAWAFHKGGAKEPTLVTTWLDYQTVAGVRVPTRFTTPDGKDFIRIVNLSAE